MIAIKTYSTKSINKKTIIRSIKLTGIRVRSYICDNFSTSFVIGNVAARDFLVRY